MLDLLKVLLKDVEEDKILEFYLDLAKNNIKLYLNSNLNGVNENVIVLLASYYYENRTRLGGKIKSETDGDKSYSYNTYITSIPNEFINMLPLPKVGVFG